MTIEKGKATLLLARHGQTVWHAENRYAGGASDVDLTPAGIEQACALAAFARLRGVDVDVEWVGRPRGGCCLRASQRSRQVPGTESCSSGSLGRVASADGCAGVTWSNSTRR